MKDSNFLKVLKELEPDELPETTFFDTGSYMLNALMSGSIYGGLPSNRIVGLAGGESVGKSYIATGAVDTFLKSNENAIVLYFDSEFATDKEFLKRRNIDASRFMLFQPETLQEFQTQLLKILTAAEEEEEEDRPKFMVILDSLGNLPTTKELKDATEGSGVQDMTRAKVIRSIFRTVTSRLGKLSVPTIVVNHTYDNVGGYGPTKQMSGGGGLKYAARIILFLTRTRDKDDKTKEVHGNFITFKTEKSIFTKEQKDIELKLSFETGLDRYYGLLELAAKYGIFKEVGNKYETPDGKKYFASQINNNPEKFFTKDILDQLDEAAAKEYKLGAGASVQREQELEQEIEAELEG